MEERRRRSTSWSPLVECAELVLPWLTPAELANVSLCCKSLRRVADSVTAARRSDAGRGMEAHPIPFVGLQCRPYSFFLYAPSSISTPLLSLRQPWGGGHGGGGGGVSVRLKIVWESRKGWCLCADEFVPEGTFVCEYAGELLTTDEARRRRRRANHALLVVREHLPSGKACLRLNIDATAAGNVARFINHSCDGGNLSSSVVRSPGDIVPRLCFSASEDILKDEELTFSYGGGGGSGKPCFCGTPCCSGWLPSEPT